MSLPRRNLGGLRPTETVDTLADLVRRTGYRYLGTQGMRIVYALFATADGTVLDPEGGPLRVLAGDWIVFDPAVGTLYTDGENAFQATHRYLDKGAYERNAKRYGPRSANRSARSDRRGDGAATGA